jgi:hypothetical protein
MQTQYKNNNNDNNVRQNQVPKSAMHCLYDVLSVIVKFNFLIFMPQFFGKCGFVLFKVLCFYIRKNVKTKCYSKRASAESKFASHCHPGAGFVSAIIS